MRSLPIALALSFAVSLGLPDAHEVKSATTSAPVPGPGAVYQSVALLLSATDAGDAAKATGVLQPMGDGYGWQWSRDEHGELQNGPPEGDGKVLSFVDVAGDGSVLALDSIAAVAKAVREQFGATDMKSHIVSVHADCQSEHCSWAHVVFDRMFTRADGTRVSVPMRATALMRYRAEAPNMRIYHWHASATGPVQLLK